MVKTLLPRWRGLASTALCAAALASHAQTPAPSGRPDPLDATATVPALVYRSSIAPARRAEPERPITWREANDTVARIGGWRAYARESNEPTPAGHGGHKTP